MTTQQAIATLREHLAGMELPPDERKQVQEAFDVLRQPPAGAWLPIESAPKDGTPIYVYRWDKGMQAHIFGSAYWHDVAGISGWMSRGVGGHCDGLGLASPTHWQSLIPPGAHRLFTEGEVVMREEEMFNITMKRLMGVVEEAMNEARQSAEEYRDKILGAERIPEDFVYEAIAEIKTRIQQLTSEEEVQI